MIGEVNVYAALYLEGEKKNERAQLFDAGALVSVRALVGLMGSSETIKENDENPLLKLSDHIAIHDTFEMEWRTRTNESHHRFLSLIC